MIRNNKTDEYKHKILHFNFIGDAKTKYLVLNFICS